MNPRHEELIDQHLSGRISADGQKELDEALKQDPGLKEQFNFQKEIVSAIKTQRHAQLKSRLDALPVSSGVATWKKAVVAGMAALITVGGGVFYYNTIDDNTTLVETVQVEEQQSDKITKEPSPEMITEEADKATEKEEETSDANPALDASQENTADQDDIQADEQITTAQAKHKDNTPETTSVEDDGPNAPHAHAFDDENEGIKDKSNDDPKGSNFTGEDYQKKYTEPKIVKNNKPFQYVYDGENLTLYGDFDRSSPYYLIELNRNKDIFLKYKGTYYRIEKADNKALLKDYEVTDKATLKKLDEAE